MYVILLIANNELQYCYHIKGIYLQQVNKIITMSSNQGYIYIYIHLKQVKKLGCILQALLQFICNADLIFIFEMHIFKYFSNSKPNT